VYEVGFFSVHKTVPVHFQSFRIVFVDAATAHLLIADMASSTPHEFPEESQDPNDNKVTYFECMPEVTLYVVLDRNGELKTLRTADKSEIPQKTILQIVESTLMDEARKAGAGKIIFKTSSDAGLSRMQQPAESIQSLLTATTCTKLPVYEQTFTQNDETVSTK
jgi:hypothetical protein